MSYGTIQAGTLGLALGSVFMMIWTAVLIASGDVPTTGLQRSDIVLRFVVLGMFVALGVLAKICHDQHHRLKRLEEKVFSKKGMEPS